MPSTDGSLAPASTRPFSQALRDSVRPVDVLAVCAVPAVLVGVFALPVETRRAMAFAYGDPSLATAYAANFVHLDAGHLAANVLAYAFVVPVCYLLWALGGTRRRFYVVFATFLLALPFALSLSNLVVPRTGFTVGFSGIVMAFAGVLPLAIATYLDEQFGVDATQELAGALFFIGLALVAVLGVRSAATGAAAGMALGGAALYAVPVLEQARDERVRSDLRAVAGVPGYLELAAAGVIVFVSLPAVAFPVETVDAGVVNRYVHLVGFSLGFVPAYATTLLAPRVAAWERCNSSGRLSTGSTGRRVPGIGLGLAVFRSALVNVYPLASGPDVRAIWNACDRFYRRVLATSRFE